MLSRNYFGVDPGIATSRKEEDWKTECLDLQRISDIVATPGFRFWGVV